MNLSFIVLHVPARNQILRLVFLQSPVGVKNVVGCFFWRYFESQEVHLFKRAFGGPVRMTKLDFHTDVT